MAEQPEAPEEIQDYYQTERRERTGVAWLLAFGTLVVTIVVAGGIFFAGRWAYREIAGTDDDSTEIAQNEEQEQSETERQEGQEPSSGQGSAAEDEAGTLDTPQGAVQGNNTATPTTGDSEGDLPDTGPGGTAAVFFAISIMAYMGHRLYAKHTQE